MTNQKYLIAGASHVLGLNQLCDAKVIPSVSSNDFILGISAVPLFSEEIKDYIELHANDVDHIFLFVSDFRYGNYYLSRYENFNSPLVSHKTYDSKYSGIPLMGFAPLEKDLINPENDLKLYKNGLAVLDYYKKKYQDKISFIFWDLYIRENYNIKNKKYIHNGNYQHPTWNYYDLIQKYKINTLNIDFFGDKIDEYTFDQQGHPSFKGYYFLLYLFRLKNPQLAFEITEKQFDIRWNNFFTIENSLSKKKDKVHLNKKLYKEIDFPLNVYAFLSYFETGDFRELHYGLFDSPKDTFIQAQKNSTDLLFKYLYKSPAKVLEVGIGLGTTHQKLMNKGFICTGITPDQAQIDIVQGQIPDANLTCTTLENFSMPANSFDILLFQESAQYIATDKIFEKANNLLSENGRILIVDEFSIGVEGLHDIDSFKTKAKEYGFDILTCMDLSEKVKPTEEVILSGLKKFKNKFMETLNLTNEQIDHLIDAVSEHQDGYRKKQRGYFFLELKK